MSTITKKVPVPVPTGFCVVEYSSEYSDPIVRMWRAAFEQAVGVVDKNPIEQQRAYLEKVVVPNNRVLVVLDEGSGDVVGFSAVNSKMIDHLYIHIKHQGKGLGTALLNHAKENSNGGLQLYTFKSNAGAQRFYEQHDFKIIARGFEEMWQLEDILYEWEGRV